MSTTRTVTGAGPGESRGALRGYEGRIGRYGASLADALIDVAGLRPGQRALDVGAGTGALTARLDAMLGSSLVSAVDPDLRERVPGVETRVARAEDLPDGAFDATLAQLVVSLVDDGPRAATEMRRVTRVGGVVATCVWDFGAARVLGRGASTATSTTCGSRSPCPTARRACSSPASASTSACGSGTRSTRAGPAARPLHASRPCLVRTRHGVTLPFRARERSIADLLQVHDRAGLPSLACPPPPLNDATACASEGAFR